MLNDYVLVEIIGIIFVVIVALYSISVVTFIILENRSPQSTFAWMFLFFIFPMGGLVIYLLFGRDWKAFSRANKLIRQELSGDLDRILTPRLPRQDKVIAELEKASKTAYKRKLLRLAYSNSNSILTVHNCLDILQDAAKKYPRLMADIEQAQRSIHLEYYIWAADVFTEKLRAILIDKVKAGVEVRLLYDPIGSFSQLSWKYIRQMRAGGIKAYPFSPPYWLHTISYRNHRKIAVIDGKIGYLGGLNMSQEHLDGGVGFTSWRDTHLRLVGDSVTALQAIFAVDWYNATYEKLSAEAYFPPLDPAIAQAYLPVQLTTSGPDSQWQAIRQLYFLMILSAERHVYLQSPFFIIDTSIAEALKAAALAGIEVKIMLAPRGAGNQMPYWAAHTYIKEMAEAGVRIFFYQNGYFHPKTLTIDTEICSIGSANMDIRSFSINYEVNAVIYDKAVAEQLAQDFFNDMAYCTEFNLEAYEESNVFFRLRDSMARLFSPLL
jgi:cardiolipin synthase